MTKSDTYKTAFSVQAYKDTKLRQDGVGKVYYKQSGVKLAEGHFHPSNESRLLVALRTLSAN